MKEHFALFPISTDPEECNRFSVRRNHLWKDAIRAMSKLSFDNHKAIRVTFLGEPSIDEGGPKKEFFYLALKSMASDSSIFQGSPEKLSFRRNPQALMERKYFYAGKLVALSLANGGPGLPCLSKAVYNYFCHALNLTVYPSIEDLPDVDVKEQLKRVCY